MKPLPEIAKCKCGAEAVCEWYENADGIMYYTAQCSKPATPPDYEHICWCGPLRRTERGAIVAWNKIMEKGK